MKKLNLGCGQFKKDGYINLDISPLSKADVIHDLDSFPYPFNANTFDLTEADHLLEHLSNPFQVMVELHRIAKPGETIHIRVPHFSRGFTHPKHKRGFDVTFPLYFNPKKRAIPVGVLYIIHNRKPSGCSCKSLAFFLFTSLMFLGRRIL